MNIGILATIIASILVGGSSVVQKKIATRYNDNTLALVFQYSAIVFFMVVFGAIRASWQGKAYIPTLSLYGLISVIAVGIIGYIGIALLYKAFDYMPTGIAIVIANTCTFMMYFINLSLYPGQESFSVMKIIFAVLFFCILVVFLLDQDKGRGSPTSVKKSSRKHILYPIGTAICRSIYFLANSYFIKSGMMSPVQTGMLTESIILIVAIIRFLVWQLHNKKRKGYTRCIIPTKKYVGLFLLIGILNALNTYLTYYGFLTISANMVNVIKLFSIPVSAFGAWMFLKDILTRKQTILLIIAVVLMIGFVMV